MIKESSTPHMYQGTHKEIQNLMQQARKTHPAFDTFLYVRVERSYNMVNHITALDRRLDGHALTPHKTF